MIYRNCLACNRTWLQRLTNIRTFYSNSIHCEENSTDDKNVPENKGKELDPKHEENKETYNKLNDLLMLMKKPQDVPESAMKIKIPKPREKAQKKAFELRAKKEEVIEQTNMRKLGNRLEQAAKKVAHSYGGDTEKTEIELLDLYLGKKKMDKEKDKPLKANELPPDLPPADEKTVDLSEVLSQMKVDTDTSAPTELSRAYQVRSILGEKFGRQPLGLRKRRYGPKYEEQVEIFGGTPLNIFNVEELKKKSVQPVQTPTWDFLFQRDLRLNVTHPPTNIFEQLILWTEQGKVWKFPIDNEQGMIEESKFDFADHVFLEPLIDHWCPKSGPLRQFMQLVCVGMSKNPYLTVEEKRAHLCWYEHYFKHKNELLRQTGVEGPLDKDQQIEGSARS